MFDEEPDADPHGECSAEIHKLQGLLREALGVIHDARRYGAGDWSDLERRIDAELQGRGEQRPQWRCFHCDALFTDSGEARLHFGPSEHSAPVCQIDAAALRDLEETLRRYREEDTDLHRALYAKDCKHAVALRRAEEQGYATGLADAAGEVRELIASVQELLAGEPEKSERLTRALVHAGEVANATHPVRLLSPPSLPTEVRERMVRIILDAGDVPATGRASFDDLNKAVLGMWNEAVEVTKTMSDKATVLKFAHGLIASFARVMSSGQTAAADAAKS